MKSTHHKLSGAIALLIAVAIPAVACASASIPVPQKTVAPHVAGDLREATGEVRVAVEINQYGFVTDARIEDSTNPALNEPALEAIHQWTFTPARDGGIPVSSKAIQPFYFNNGSLVLSEKAAPEDTNPSVKNRVQPKLRDELKSITGEVVLQASVDERGRVNHVEIKSSTHEELEASAIVALSDWSFKPATKAGEAVSSKIIVPFRFAGENVQVITASARDSKSLDKAPVALRQPIPELPSQLRNERGEAKIMLTIDEHGYVADVETLESSNEALALAAREAAFQWKFKPAIKDGVAVAAKVVQPFSFNGGLLLSDLPVDSMPTVKKSKSPELPEALTGVHGFVKVRLNLDEQGRVLSASSAKSSHDELVEPTLEAARSWTFKPAVRDGQKVPSSVIVPFVFNERS